MWNLLAYLLASHPFSSHFITSFGRTWAHAITTAVTHRSRVWWRSIKQLLLPLLLWPEHHWSAIYKNSKGQRKLAARLAVPSVCSRLVMGGKLRAGKTGVMLREAASSKYTCAPGWRSTANIKTRLLQVTVSGIKTNKWKKGFIRVYKNTLIRKWGSFWKKRERKLNSACESGLWKHSVSDHH